MNIGGRIPKIKRTFYMVVKLAPPFRGESESFGTFDAAFSAFIDSDGPVELVMVRGYMTEDGEPKAFPTSLMIAGCI